LAADDMTYTPCNQAVLQVDTRCSANVAPPRTTPLLHSQKTTMQKCDAASSFLSFPTDLSNYVSALAHLAYPRAEPEIHRFLSNAGRKLRRCLWLRNRYLVLHAFQIVPGRRSAQFRLDQCIPFSVDPRITNPFKFIPADSQPA
jgi:hypothetical protein